MIDFNSIIHNISQSIGTSLIYLYHISCVSKTYPQILIQSKSNIEVHISNIKTINDYKLSNTEINFHNLIINDFNILLFNIFNEEILDNFIIHKVAEYIEILISYFPSIEYIYMAIDGVPLFAKMIEQKKRRTIGHILTLAKSVILESFKSELDVSESSENKVYYNHYNFEKKIINFRFNKNKISPGCQFMTNLQTYVSKHLGFTFPKIKFDLDPFENPGEGEKKIVYKIHQLKKEGKTGQITTYSPDADVILLMLLELDKFPIQIMRYDQQLSQLDIINVIELKKVIIEYMRYNIETISDQTQHLIIKDIVMLFTILGNDFLPKLKIINTNKHVRQIFDVYQKLNQNIKPETNNFSFIFSQRDQTNKYIHNINWLNLRKFFINLQNQLKTYDNNYKPHKEWTIKSDQIVNSNSIQYYQHIFNIENLANMYEPSINITEDNTEDIKEDITENKISLKYLQGFIWLSKYYLDHNFDYKLFHYKYQSSPTIPLLINNINRIIKSEKLYDKIINNLNKTIITDSNYFKPITQLIYITPNNILNICDKQLLTENIHKLIINWDKKYNKKIDLIMNNNQVNIYDYLNCSDVIFLSKCEIKNLPKLSGKLIIKKFSSPSARAPL